jgi:hypothetical protein
MKPNQKAIDQRSQISIIIMMMMENNNNNNNFFDGISNDTQIAPNFKHNQSIGLRICLQMFVYFQCFL